MISIRDIAEELDALPDQASSYLHKGTGQVLTLLEDDIELAEEDAFEDLPEWQQEVVAEAREVLASDDWIKLPGKFEIHEWNIMEAFSQTLSAQPLCEDIERALHGKGAFRNFKATVRRHGLEQDWYAFKARALEAFVRKWLIEQGLLSD